MAGAHEPARSASATTDPGQWTTPEGLVDRVVESVRAEPSTRHLGDPPLPDGRRVAELVELVRDLVFPGFFNLRGLTDANLRDHVTTLVSRIGAHAIDQTRSALRYAQRLEAGERDATAAAHGRPALDAAACEHEARRITGGFLEALPALRSALALDVRAAYDGDPAATHTDETIFSYPGVDAVFAYRVAHVLLRLGAPMLPRIICEQAHGRTGIDIHPGATIGPSFFIDHGAGVVIGETTVIGEHVKIYQGVTLGAKSFPLDDRGRLIRNSKRHPTIGDRVTIYAGAVILGGDTVIGDDCVISGGVFLTESAPARHIVRQKKPELVMRTNKGAQA